MKKEKVSTKFFSLVLTLALLMSCTANLGSAQQEVYAESSKESEESHDAEEQKEDATEAVSSASELAQAIDGRVDKRETAYVLMDADGEVDQIIVSEQLSNAQQADEIADFSTLEEITNTSGEESFTQDGQNLSWQAKGKRIDYQGKYQGELPVKVAISYYLDGEQKSAAEIVGQAGEVKIRFDYEISRQDLIEDKSYLHPYLMVSGMALDNDYFSEVQVSNGKIIDDGSNTLVVGVALPGMNENLGLEREDFAIPASVEISAKTTSFTLPGTYSIALSGMLSDYTLSDTDQWESKMNELKRGLNTLATSSKLLVKGMENVFTGAVKLDQGLNGLNDGLGQAQDGSENLEAGASELNQGLAQLSANSQNLNAGINQLEQSIFESAAQQLVQELGLSEVVLTPENYSQVLEGIAAQLSQAPSPAAEAGAQKLAQLQQQLDGVVALASGIRNYTAGVDAASAGSAQLLEGVSALKQGSAELEAGAKELTKGSKKLTGGLDKLKRSLEKFDQDGIQRLVEELNKADLEDLLQNIKGIKEAAAQDYLIGGKTEEMTGESKIIFKTAAIKLEGEN